MSEAPRLLLVESGPRDLRALAEMLRSAGYEVREARSGAEGLQQVLERKPAVVLAEANVQDLSATEAYRQFIDHIRFGLQAARMVTWDYDIARGSLRYSDNMADFVGGSAIGPYCDMESVLLQIHPEDRDAVRQGLKRAEAPGALFEEEYRARMLDGSYRWIHAKGQVIRDATGAAAHIHGVSMDFTERKQGEAALRESEALNRRLAQAVQSTSEPICITDLADRFTFVNRAFEQVYGYSQEEILGKNPSILVSPKNPSSLLEEVLGATRHGGWRGEILDVRKDGSEFPVHLSTSQVKDQTGQVIGLIGVAQDISERRRAEEQIHLLADALQSAQEIISVADPQDRLMFVNAAFLKAYGYTEAEVLGQTPEFLYSLTSPPGICRHVHEKTLEGGWRGELLNRRKDGTEFPISLSTSEIKTGAGKLLGLLGVARDISERRQVERLQRALVGLGYRLSAATLPAKAAEIILDVASDLFGWDAGYVHLYSEADDRLERLQTMDTIGGKKVAVPPPSSAPSPLMRQVMNEGARIFQRDGNSTVPGDLQRFGDAERLSASMMYVPIRSDGKAIGVLSIQSYTRDAYTGTDLQLLQGLADYCGDALRRIRVRAELDSTRRLQQTILDHIPDPAWLRDTEGRFLACNSALGKFYDRRPEELVGLTIVEVSALDGATMYDEDTMVIKSRQTAVFEQVRTDALGKKRWFQSIKAPVFDERGEVIATVGIARETTEHKRLEEELRRWPHRIIEAQEAERQRVARELHDSVNQILASAQMRLRRVEESGAEFRPSTREILARCHDLMVQALEENRRIAHDLRPSDLDELGLAVACRNFCQQFQARTHLAVTCRLLACETRLAPAAELHLFRIVQEAFNNALKHARASRIRLHLSCRGSILRLKIQDDGCGFDPAAPRPAKGKRTGIGLTNIRERATALGGTCEVESAPRRGTTITVLVPLAPLIRKHEGRGT